MIDVEFSVFLNSGESLAETGFPPRTRPCAHWCPTSPGQVAR